MEIGKIEKLLREENERLSTRCEKHHSAIHDVNNILTIMNGVLALMREDLKAGEVISRHIDVLEKNVKALEKTLTKSLSTRDLEVFRIFKVFELVQEFYDDYCVEILGGKSSFSTKLDESTLDLEILVQKSSFFNALLNLIMNSIDAFEEQNVELQNRHIKFYLYMKDSMVVLEIEDNAGGVHPDYQDKMFTKFFTTKSVKGTGLGLVNVKRIFKIHKGDVVFQNNYPHGAKFILTLPIYQI